MCYLFDGIKLEIQTGLNALVEGDPTKDFDFLTDPANLLVIMKGGVQVKDILPAA